MAEFLIAARDLPSLYRRGDPITVQADGHRWGTAEILGDEFYVVKVPSVTVDEARPLVRALYEDAVAGDPELDAPDPEDRRIKRHKRGTRLVIDLLPVPKRSELTALGFTTLTRGQAIAAYRRLVWNRATEELDEGDEALS